MYLLEPADEEALGAVLGFGAKRRDHVKDPSEINIQQGSPFCTFWREPVLRLVEPNFRVLGPVEPLCDFWE